MVGDGTFPNDVDVLFMNKEFWQPHICTWAFIPSRYRGLQAKRTGLGKMRRQPTKCSPHLMGFNWIYQDVMGYQGIYNNQGYLFDCIWACLTTRDFPQNGNFSTETTDELWGGLFRCHHRAENESARHSRFAPFYLGYPCDGNPFLSVR